MDTDQTMATSIMTYDPQNPSMYVQGQVVFHDGSFFTVDKDNPDGIPVSSDDFTIIENSGTTNFDNSNTSNYQQGQLVNDGDSVYLVVKNNPEGVPGSSDDYKSLSGEASEADFLVSPGSGALGTAAPFNAQSNNLTFEVTGVTGTAKAAGIKISVLTGPSGPVVLLDGSELARAVSNLMVTQTYDPGEGEQDTGTTYRGKPVYRRAFEFTTNRAAKAQDDRMLIDVSGYVEAVVNTGGYWMTGNQAEKYPVNAAYVAPDSLYGFAYVDINNKLVFRSNSSLNRDGSVETANNFVWVDYTRVDDTSPPAPSSV